MAENNPVDIPPQESSTISKNDPVDILPEASSTISKNDPVGIPPEASSTIAKNDPVGIPPEASSTIAENDPVDIPPEASSTIAENNFSATPVICRQELCAHGHDIFIEFSITNALLIPDEWTICQDVTTLCEKTPTSWKLRIILDKPKNLQVVSGDARITRTDSIKYLIVEISMEMKVYHQQFGYHTAIEPSNKLFFSGQTLFIYIDNIVPSKHKDLLLNEKLDFNVRLSIRDCHYRPLKPPPKPYPVKTEEWKPLPIDKRWHHTQR